jgi:diguanylate cyclase (GGDEF)-like protein
MHLTTPAGAARGTTFKAPRSRALTLALVVAGLLIVFVVDRMTGAAPFQHLYYLPIILAALRFGRRGGLLTALAAILLYHLANPHLLRLKYEEGDVVQIALFAAIGLITARLQFDAQCLRRLASTDDLTGLHNLRSFEARLAVLIARAREARTPLALLVLDVDRLKSLNDVHGHLAGAEAVRAVGHIIGATLPPDAMACRYGGDEFVVALPDCRPAHARTIADDLRRAVAAAAPVLAGVRFPAATLSISVGLACQSFGQDDAGPGDRHARDAGRGEALFRAADLALYEAKSRGRNQVWAAPESERRPGAGANAGHAGHFLT